MLIVNTPTLSVQRRRGLLRLASRPRQSVLMDAHTYVVHCRFRCNMTSLALLRQIPMHFTSMHLRSPNKCVRHARLPARIRLWKASPSESRYSQIPYTHYERDSPGIPHACARFKGRQSAREAMQESGFVSKQWHNGGPPLYRTPVLQADIVSAPRSS